MDLNQPARRIQGLLIPVDGPLQEITLPAIPSLAQLQELAGGGCVEALRIPDAFGGLRATAYVNENYPPRDDLAPNRRATDFLVPGFGLATHDYVSGPMLLFGFDPVTGDPAPELPEQTVNRARLIEREAGSLLRDDIRRVMTGRSIEDDDGLELSR